MAFDFDLFVIGAGSGGVRAARIASSHGARVAVAHALIIEPTILMLDKPLYKLEKKLREEKK